MEKEEEREILSLAHRIANWCKAVLFIHSEGRDLVKQKSELKGKENNAFDSE